MAAGILSKPGTEFGPCQSACVHKDCNQTRTMARTKCVYCDQAIGYETRFYKDDKGLVHAECHEDAIAKEQKGVPDPS